MSETAKQTPRTYRGNCHCGAFVFEVEAPEITSAFACNCSICTKRGYLWGIFTGEDNIKVVKDDGLLVDYYFGPKKTNHKFCSKCGIAPIGYNDSSPKDNNVAVNVRVIQDLDTYKLKIDTMDGAALDPQYDVPTYTGPEPPAKFESGPGHTYHGSCHCGAVTLALKMETPLDHTYKGQVIECNCSICRRAGYTWVYPAKDQTVIQGAENLSYYVFATTNWRKAFCKTCGVHLLNVLNPLTDEEVAALSDSAREFRATRGHMRPVNIRVLNGFDLKSIEVTKSDNGTKFGVPYVNP
ncbi:Mss4-like protein [Podospora didyma]|uniref:Mss4-like protein n=1 Tax=Podospora didyma TaxID=330526 RepID=A0AAE0NZK1_9PEZI|nr:Mss4-like protein [Podospora didyma]